MKAVPEGNGRLLNDIDNNFHPVLLFDSEIDGANTKLKFNPQFTSDGTSFLHPENSHLEIAGQSFSYSGYGTGGTFQPYGFLSIPGHHSFPVNTEFRIYDDDGSILPSPLPCNDLVDSVIQNAYKPAFIDVVDAKDWNKSKFVPFFRNADPTVDFGVRYGIWDDALDAKLVGTKRLWTAAVVCGFQGSYDTDGDPKSEGHEEGMTPVRMYAGSPVSGGAKVSIIWTETIRDNMETSGDLNTGDLHEKYMTRIKLTATHEIGHQPRFLLGEDHHQEMGLMRDGGAESADVDSQSSKFMAPSIIRFRKADKWVTE